MFILERIIKMRISNFDIFLKESLDKDLRDKLSEDDARKIITRWDDGYDLIVRESLEGKIFDPSSIFILKKTEKAYGLGYQSIDGGTSKYFWIPSYACKIIPYGSNSKKIQIPAYTRWFKNQETRLALDNFLNDFMEAIEQRKNDAIDQVKESAKDDIDIVLDELGLNDSVASIEKKSDYNFSALTENGLEIEMYKRSTGDLMGEIKIYKDKDSSKPAIKCGLNGKSGKPYFSFAIGSKYYNFSGFFSEISDDKYFKYLLRKSLGTEDISDEEGLVSYFENILSNHDWDYQMSDDSKYYKRGEAQKTHISEVSGLLKEFLPDEKVSGIYSRFSKQK